jgi:hypothetical protein
MFILDGIIVATCKQGIPDTSGIPDVDNSVNNISANIALGLIRAVHLASKHILIKPLL